MADEPSQEDLARVQKESCVFCKIIKGDIPSRKVFEDELVIAILDINPAAKGHTLVMPKEHYPILPVIPPGTFKHTFRTTKHIMKAVREGMITVGTTCFIANGAVAGQQSPHFLFHIIPRDANDSLSNFSLPEGKGDDGEKLYPALQANIAAIMRQYLQREGLLKSEVRVAEQEKFPEEGGQGKNAEPAPPEPPPRADAKHSLAETIMANEELRNLIMSDPEKVKKLIEEDREYAALFSGINIDKLSEKLKEIERKKKPEPSRTDLDAISRLFR